MPTSSTPLPSSFPPSHPASSANPGDPLLLPPPRRVGSPRNRECGPGCGCGPECGNRLIQNGVAVRVKIVRDARKGWCLHSDQWIRKKEFLFEYAVLVSRQFVDMTRMRIEGLLAAFPKLIGTGKQHTYVETENVRYVYQPMEALYLLLITNKQSNILEDLDTLRILSKLENVTVAQVKQYCEMESHEEKLHRQMREDKIREAKDEMKRKANEIDKNKV
ncbi:Coatomer subunit [Arachis hypogaea]|nr:Coatomer subunit [Arachis hypogaea]